MDAIKLLLERASAIKVRDPGPTQEELDIILASSLRAPDHGRLRPWHFIVISGEGRARFGTVLADALKVRAPTRRVRCSIVKSAKRCVRR